VTLLVIGLLLGTCCAFAQETEEAEKVALSFKDTPIQEAAQQVGDMIERVVVVGEGVQGEVTLHVDVPVALALRTVAATVSSYPAEAVIFCTEAQACGAAELKTDKSVSLELAEETPLSDAARQLAKQGGMRIAATPAVAATKVTCEFEDTPLVEALDGLAKQAECTWVQGFVLVKVDPDKALENFSKLPTGDQERLLNQGLDALDQAKVTPGQMDAMLAQGYQRFRGMSPEERKAEIEWAAARIKQLSALLHNMNPETQSRVRAAIAPMVERGVEFFVHLDAAEQAELMPIMNAISTLE